MPRYFTHYWQNDTWSAYRATATSSELADYAASNLFHQRGVTRGDYLYIVTIFRGALYLLTKFEVAKICQPEEAATELGEDPDALWPADYYAIAAAAAPSDFDREVPHPVARQLRFTNSQGIPKPLTFRANGQLDQQTLRGVRELTPASAALLDALLLPLIPVHLDRRRTALATLLPNEVLSHEGPTRFVEGAVIQITINAYERNARARAACIRAHGTTCTACGFDFGATYGPVAAGYIHIHHLRPLAMIQEEYDLDPVADLVPVCPNCHAVIHLRRENPYTIQEIRELLAVQHT